MSRLLRSCNDEASQPAGLLDATRGTHRILLRRRKTCTNIALQFYATKQSYVIVEMGADVSVTAPAKTPRQ
jgi:hypothetical protein